MRYQEKISKWIDDNGYRFITQDGSNEQIFVHISGFEKGIQRPTVGEVLSYEVASDVNKGLKAYKIKSNCPSSIADGDVDGIPCEDQWCGH